MTGSRPVRRHPERAEPRSIGTSGTRNILAREVRLLGALLGEIIVEQAGDVVFELVESTRQQAIAARRRGPEERVSFDVLPVDAPVLEGVVRAFGLYFQLINLAEARDRVRRATRRARATAGASEGARLRSALRRGDVREALAQVRISPVLTAHPTEARRRTVLVNLRRIARLLERADDPRIAPSVDRDLRRQLREEIAVLWRTAELRRGAPSPLDEVRTAMVVFDETLYRLTPQLYGLVDTLLPGPRSARARELQEPQVPAFLRFGSWIGADRDGHPMVTATVTEEASRIQTDHVLRGHEAVATRLSQALAMKIRGDAVPRNLAHRLGEDEVAMAQLARSLAERFPDEPFRQRFGFIAERLRHTRVRLLGERRGATTPGYLAPAELIAELREIQDALVEIGLARSAWGDVQDFVWQVETFGFHLAALEVRQHAEVHRRALAAAHDGAGQSSTDDGVVPRPDEVLETFRSMARIQHDLGAAALSRYIVSFTSGAADVLAVLELADAAGVGEQLVLDVVPLFETSDALTSAGSILEALLADPRYRRHLRARGDRQEVMLGYSDSNKESGYVAANWLLYQAQANLTAVAARAGIELTLFHGRGGAIGRGGGQLALAVAAQPPGSVAGRLKVTEQGEIVWTRYGDPELALRHLEALTVAALDTIPRPDDDADAGEPPPSAVSVMDELATTARHAYRALVHDDPGFAGFFARLTPIDEIARLQLGSRPPKRSAGRPDDRSIDDLRAIPWVFAWSQARVELPAWFGLGSAIETFEAGHPLDGDIRLGDLYASWAFFRSLIDHARLAVARADIALARSYASLATEDGDGARWTAIESEFQRTRRALERLPLPVAATTPADRAEAEAVRRSAGLRAPYVDTLSVLQLALLRVLREREAADPAHPSIPLIRPLIALTISGLSAALQGTG
ncbi:MAG TPA: phosphoenolpyruvate carboxylase [Candidatus Limnocylindrales bacterium]|nr:phosphoenolpyruvate carboxylase [Candidatus Limnocylindrales bacterium]